MSSLSHKKIKVVVGVTSLIVGGVQRLIVDQLRYMDRSKYEIHLFVFFDHSQAVQLFDELPKDIHVSRFNFKGLMDIRSWLSCFHRFRRVSPDVIVSHLFFSNFLLRIINVFVGRRPVIVVEHNTYIDKRAREIWADKILTPFTYKVVAVSDEVKKYVENLLRPFKANIIVIPNGIDMTNIENHKRSADREALRAQYGVKNDEHLYLNVARLADQKNHIGLISGFAQYVTAGNRGAKLFIIGEGKLLQRLSQLVSDLQMTDSIFILGARPQSVVYDYMVAADCFISASFIEGLSLAYLEAAAFGLPLLVTQTAGTVGLVEPGKNGYFIQAADSSAVYAALQQISVQSFQALQSKARETVARFDIRTNVAYYQSLVEEALEHGKL